MYGENKEGEQLASLYERNLKGSEIAVFRRVSNVGDLLHDDDYFGYFGGLGLTIRNIDGKTPEMYVTNLENPKDAKLETLEKSLRKDIRTRYFNPKWIGGMQGHGAAGAREFSRFHEFLFGWDVSTPEIITDDVWDESYEIYVKDKYEMGMKEFFDRSNPYAYQSIVARMLEASRKGYWNASDEILQDLAKRYVESVADDGVTCCHHTCGNPFMDKYVANILSIPGVIDASVMEAYREQVDKSSGKTKGGVGETKEVMGHVMERKIKETASGIASSGAPMMGLIAVLIMLVLVYLGFRRKRRG
jgi:cobaltochelatase CobN